VSAALIVVVWADAGVASDEINSNEINVTRKTIAAALAA
jgi:hypothetical protein